jgi:putative membrane protein
MKNITVAATLLAILGALAAPTIAQDSGASTSNGGNVGPNEADQKFVTQAVHSNDQEIDQAVAELNATKDANVRLFAQIMIRDHTLANGQLGAAAKGVNLQFSSSHIAQGNDATPPPTENGSARMAAISPKAYMTQEVKDHQMNIALYQGESRNGNSDSIKTYAAQTLPILNQHLAMAQQYLSTGHVTPQGTPNPGGANSP